MLDSIGIDPNNWPTSAVLDWIGILRRMPAIPNAGSLLADAEGIIRARLNFQATTMGFSTERSDALWWLMISSDSNAVRAVLTLMDRTGLAFGHSTNGPRRNRPSAVRSLEHDGRQRVGRSGDGKVLCRVRIGACHRHDEAVVRPLRAVVRVAADANELTEQLPWQDGRNEHRIDPARHGPAVGHDTRDGGAAVASSRCPAAYRSNAA